MEHRSAVKFSIGYRKYYGLSVYTQILKFWMKTKQNKKEKEKKREEIKQKTNKE